MRMNFTRRAAVAAVAAAMAAPLSFASLSPVLAADVTLKLGWTTSDGAKDPYAIAARAFADALQAEAPGAFEVQFFPNRQLGDEKEMLEGLSFGTLDAAVIANIEPAFQLNDMPFLYSSEADAHKVLDGEVGQAMLAKLASRKIVGLGFAEGGFRNMINNVRPVSAPADVEGVKFRVMQNPVFIGMFKSLGGNAVPMAWGETYTAVQQGTIDGLEIPVAVIKSNKYAEVTKYLSLTKHTYSALGMMMSQKAFDKLSSKQQAAVCAATTAAVKAQRTQVAANTAEIIAALKAAGMEVNEVSDPAAFRGLVGGVYEEFKPGIGAELFDKALAQVQ